MENEIEIEETFEKKDFARILRELAEALESSESFAISIKNQVVSIPPNGIMKIEFESRAGQNEVELELSWKSVA